MTIVDTPIKLLYTNYPKTLSVSRLNSYLFLLMPRVCWTQLCVLDPIVRVGT